MTSVESYTNIYQCQAREFQNTENEATAQAHFRRAAEQRIRSFLQDNGLPAEEASEISFDIYSGDGDELVIQTDGNITESLLKQLGNQLLSLAVRRGICGVSYFPPSPPEENEDEEPEQPRLAQRREASPEPNVELRLGEATVEVQTPPTPAPDDEASQIPVAAKKEPAGNSVMTFLEQTSTDTVQVSLPDGRVITIYVAPGVEILPVGQSSSDTMTFE